MTGPPALVLTCEHATNAVPRDLAHHFAGARRLLDGHRGHDLGARHAARTLARATGAPLEEGRVSRLVIDLNRSAHHARLLGPPLRALPRAERTLLRERLLDLHWRPFRDSVRAHVERAVAMHGRAVHLSLHSFTPVLDGVRRSMDLAVLYDPARPEERRFADAAARELSEVTGRPVARNRPYRGTADGHTTALRREFGTRTYVGIEVELNQRMLQDGRFPGPVLAALVRIALESC